MGRANSQSGNGCRAGEGKRLYKDTAYSYFPFINAFLLDNEVTTKKTAIWAWNNQAEEMLAVDEEQGDVTGSESDAWDEDTGTWEVADVKAVQLSVTTRYSNVKEPITCVLLGKPEAVKKWVKSWTSPVDDEESFACPTNSRQTIRSP